eukprot:15162471-Heterocapsa_arctica.AAC.1
MALISSSAMLESPVQSVDWEWCPCGAWPLSFPPSATLFDGAVPLLSGWTKGGEPHPEDQRSCGSSCSLRWEASHSVGSLLPAGESGGPSPS